MDFSENVVPQFLWILIGFPMTIAIFGVGRVATASVIKLYKLVPQLAKLLHFTEIFGTFRY